MKTQEGIMTITELLKKYHPEVLKGWDVWDWRIYSPKSLDDDAVVVVILYNRGYDISRKLHAEVRLPLAAH